MMKVFLGFIVGAVATGLGFLLFDREPEQMPPPELVSNEAPASSTLSEATLNESSRSNLPENAGVSTTAEPAVPRQGVNTVEDAGSASAPAPVLPIVLPPEFDWLTSDPGFQSLQNEPMDPAWSIDTEAQINRYFAEQPEITAKYGFPTVHCRTTRCQVLVAAYGMDAASLVAAFGRSLNSSFPDQSWAEQLELGTVSTHSRNGVTTLVWVLHKSEGQR